MKYATLATTPTPQSEPLDERQVENNAGGYVYALGDLKRLERFLILGSDSATYYQSAPKLTKANSACVTRCWEGDPVATAKLIVDVSDGGRAAKNDAAIWALALGAAYRDNQHPAPLSHKAEMVRQAALSKLESVCRTSTHLFQFLTALDALQRGWGPTLKKAVARWYTGKAVDRLAYQMIKYRSREGYTHQRALELSHAPSKAEPARHDLYSWAKGKPEVGTSLPALVYAHKAAMNEGTREAKLLELIKQYRLPWEAIPTSATTNPNVWRAMLPDMGLMALVRNLGAMSSYGVFKPLGDELSTVVDRLGDGATLREARVHPFSLLQAMHVYRSGKGFRGSLTWTPFPQIADALEDAFYKAFQFVEPTGKRHLIGFDVSGSMDAQMMGSTLTCREASAALALVTMTTEKQTHVVGFTSAGHSSQQYGGKWGGGNASLTPLDISPRQRLGDAVRAVSRLPFGGTDCALPMLYALDKEIKVDVFTVITDNETWAGRIHPMVALKEYRAKTGIPAKLVVIGMTATEFSIADPADGGALDVVGFDTSAPAVIADFARG